jgi:hypothetical protein
MYLFTLCDILTFHELWPLGAPFKPSAKKNHKEVEFAATNLHLQRIYVQNDKRQTSMLMKYCVNYHKSSQTQFFPSLVNIKLIVNIQFNQSNISLNICVYNYQIYIQLPNLYTNTNISWISVHKNGNISCISACQGGCYDVTTHGVFTAGAQKYKHGGLWRQLQHLRDSMSDQDNINKMSTINKLMNSVTLLRDDVNKYCEVVCGAAVQGDASTMNNAATRIQDKVNI